MTRALAVSALVAVLAAGCAASTPSSERASAGTAVTADEPTPVDGGAIVFGVPGETTGFNPHDDTWPGWSALVATSMMEPLATLDRDLNPVPWLAVSWTPNATYDSYVIKLRPNVTFHNGEPFDAAAVKLNLDDAMTASLTSISLKGLFKAITVVDPLTVQVDLAQPWAAFPNTYLAGTTNLIMAPAMLRSPRPWQEPPGRHRAVRLRLVDARQHPQDQQERVLLAGGEAPPRSARVLGHRRRGDPERGAPSGRHRHGDDLELRGGDA